MESIISSFLKKYFQIFLRNFDSKRDFHFNWTKGEATVSNLAINEDVVRELIGVETLDVKRLYVSNCLVNVTPTKLTSVPITIDIDEVDIVLAESALPVPLPKVLGTLFKKSEKDTSTASTDYGTKDKLADGIRVRIKRLNILLRTRGDQSGSEYSSKSHPPLLMICVEDFLLEQTDDRWQTVNLEKARSFNKGKDDYFVFRQIKVKVSVMLIPCEGEEDPAFSLLLGAKLSSFVGSCKNPNFDGGGRLGATTILDRFAMCLRLTTQRKTASNALLGIQIEAVLGTLKLVLNENRIAVILHFLSALLHMLGRRSLTSASLEAHKQAAEQADVRFRQLMPKAPLKSVVHLPRFGRKESRAGPRLVVRILLQELNIRVILDENIAQPVKKKEMKEFGIELGDLIIAVSHEEHFQNDVLIKTDQLQASLFWIDVHSISTDSFKLLIYPSDQSPVLMPLELPLIDIHPHAQESEHMEALRRARSKRFSPVLLLAWTRISPCPALPEYGTDLQIRLRRLEMVIYEETILGLFYLDARLKNRVKVTNESLASPSPTVLQELEAVTPVNIVEPATPVSAKPESEYKTVQCVIDLNGPTVYYVPDGLVRPILRLRLTKILVIGNSHLREPRLGSKALCQFVDHPRFPDSPNDFTGTQPIQGRGLAFTRLELSILGSNLTFLGSRDTTPNNALGEDVDMEQPPAGQATGMTTDHFEREARTRAANLKSDPMDDESPLIVVPEITFGVSWDDTATPQFQASISIPHIGVTFSRSLLNIATVLASTTSDTFSKFIVPKEVQLTRILLLIPQPITFDKRQIDAMSQVDEVDAFALLPSYAVGIHLSKVSVAAYNNGSEVLQLSILGTEGVLEHRKASDGHAMLLKFFLTDVQLLSLSPETLRMERLLYTVAVNNSEEPLIAARFEHVLGDNTSQNQTLPANDETNNLFLRQVTRNTKLMSKLSNLVERYRQYRKHEVKLRVGFVELLSSVHTLNALSELFFFQDDTHAAQQALDEYQRGNWSLLEEKALALLKDRAMLKIDENNDKPRDVIVIPPVQVSATPTQDVYALADRLTATMFIVEVAMTNIEQQLSVSALVQHGMDGAGSIASSPSSFVADWRARTQTINEDDRSSIAGSEYSVEQSSYGDDVLSNGEELDLSYVDTQISSLNDAIASGDLSRKAFSAEQVTILSKQVLDVLLSANGSEQLVLQMLTDSFAPTDSSQSDDDLLGDFLASVARELWRKRSRYQQPVSTPSLTSLSPQPLVALVGDLPPLVVQPKATLTQQQQLQQRAAGWKAKMQTFTNKVKEKSREVVSKGTQAVAEKVAEIKEKRAETQARKTSTNASRLQAYTSSLVAYEAQTRSKLVKEVQDALHQLQQEKDAVFGWKAYWDIKNSELDESLQEKSRLQSRTEELEQINARAAEQSRLDQEKMLQLSQQNEQLQDTLRQEQKRAISIEGNVVSQQQTIRNLEEQLSIYMQQIQTLVERLNKADNL